MTVEERCPVEEIAAAYRREREAVRRSHLQVIWLLLDGMPTAEVSRVTGFGVRWIEKLIHRWNGAGLAGLGDRRRGGCGCSLHRSRSLLPPEAARIDGREGIQGFWQALIDAGVRDVALTTQEVDDFGDVANEVGTISATAPSEDGGRVQLAGKYVVVWKRGGDGTWRLHRDIWNFDA